MTEVRLDTWGACVDFPIFDAKTRSLKKSVLGKAGGVIGANDSDVVVVEALKNIDLHLEHGDRVVHAVHRAVLEQVLVVLGEGHQKHDRGDVVKVADPLLPLVALASHVQHAAADVV